MRKVRKGFTLVELLIVIAILGSLSAMMAVSSSDSIDASSASAILNNLQTLKAAAFEMYMEEPEVASMTEINLDGSSKPGIAPTEGGDERKTTAEILGARLGRKDIAAGYGLVGSSEAWYVVYTITTADSANVKSILKDKANAMGLYASSSAPTTTTNCGFEDYYTGDDDEIYIALKVR
ncbi:MAG: prepilin-type N-terminal cleavage/methylation domain-containing protein [Synergistaceae bacterium]|nr:prepilin-type N-terminal cleavage/methylation domain-containing protein [Synergistaceae bacterium]